MIHFAFDTFAISSGDLSEKHEVLYLASQGTDKSINETSPNLLFETDKLRIKNPKKMIIGNQIYFQVSSNS